MIKKSISLIAFFTEDNELLIQDRRNYNKQTKWGFFGGSIEKNETPKQALIREIKEELDYEIKEFTFFKEYHSINEEYDVKAFVFLSPLKNKLQEFTILEGQGAKLFSFNKLKELENRNELFFGDIPIIEALKKHFSSKD